MAKKLNEKSFDEIAREKDSLTGIRLDKMGSYITEYYTPVKMIINGEEQIKITNGWVQVALELIGEILIGLDANNEGIETLPKVISRAFNRDFVVSSVVLDASDKAVISIPFVKGLKLIMSRHSKEIKSSIRELAMQAQRYRGTNMKIEFNLKLESGERK